MNKYLLTIRVPIEAIDDVSARIQASLIYSQNDVRAIQGAEIKLQQISEKAPPRSVTISG